MDRVTSWSDPVRAIVDRLPDLTEAQLSEVAGEVQAARLKLRDRLLTTERRRLDDLRERVRRHLAKGAEVPRVWTDELEAEAVAQGQDGPDPEYHVAPRFGGVEMRAVPVPEAGDMCADWGPDDLIELAPGADALAPVYAVQEAQAALTEGDRCPLTGDAPADPDDDDDDDTPLVPPFTDEQEGE